MLGRKLELLVHKGRPDAGKIVIPSQVYVGLIEAAKTAMPAEAVGALIGNRPAGGEWLTIESAVPVELVPTGSGLAVGKSQWSRVKARLAGSEDTRIVGWFYADPGVGIFSPRLDIQATQQSLDPDANLLLLISSSTNQGAFYLWQGGAFVPTNGFYEALPDEEASSLIPWQGEIQGALQWLGIGSPESSPKVEAETNNKAPSPEQPKPAHNKPQEGPHSAPVSATLPVTPPQQTQSLLSATVEPPKQQQQTPLQQQEPRPAPSARSALEQPEATVRQRRTNPKLTWLKKLNRTVTSTLGVLVVVLLSILALIAGTPNRTNTDTGANVSGTAGTAVISSNGGSFLKGSTAAPPTATLPGVAVITPTLSAPATVATPSDVQPSTMAPATAIAADTPSSRAVSEATAVPTAPSGLRPFNTPMPPVTVIAAGNAVTLQSSDFTGAYRPSEGRYRNRTARLIYGQDSSYSTAVGRFNLNVAALGTSANVRLTLSGLDSEEEGKTTIRITLNEKLVYEGANPLPNSPTDQEAASQGWGTYSWPISLDILNQGVNTLSITNLSLGGKVEGGMFLALDYAAIELQK